jgi:hypothetical protein
VRDELVSLGGRDEQHAQVLAQALLPGSAVAERVEEVELTLVLGGLGEDVLEDELGVAPLGCSRVGDDQVRHVLRVAGGVRHHQVAAPRVPEQVHLRGTQLRAQRLQVGHLVGERARLRGLEGRRAPVPALVVEHDAAPAREHVPGVRAQHVRVIESRARRSP